MRQGLFTIVKNEPLTRDVYRMVLRGDTSDITAPGQFVNVKLEGQFLRRPISVCDWDGDTLALIYKVVGIGTRQMREMVSGKVLDLLTGLGNGYDVEKSGATPLLIGGGVGIPPLYALCRELLSRGKQAAVILGFNSRSEIFYREEFEALGAMVYVTTADGSAGRKGLVTDVMGELSYSRFYACGPEPMFRAIEKVAKTSGQYSFEARMGCGFGACMGCSCKTKHGNKRICREGPVLEREEVIW